MYPPIPPAITVILGILASDGTATSLTTMMAILAVGTEYVGNHLTQVRLQHPDEATRLAELIEKVKDASDASSATVPKQHVVSRTLLRHFCEVVDARRGSQLAELALQNEHVRLIGPGGAGYVLNFVKVDSATTEARWQTVEAKLPKAIEAAETGTLPHRPDLEDLLLQAVSLHFARNPLSRDIHERSFEAAYEHQLQALAAHPLAEEAFRRNHQGIVTAGPAGRRLGAEAVLENMRGKFDKGLFFRLRVEELFESCIVRFRGLGIEVLTVPEDIGAEFMMGDAPAVPTDDHNLFAGLYEGMGLGVASKVILPLTPRLVIALSQHPNSHRATNDEVAELNRLEARAAQHHVYYRPSAELSREVMGWRS